MAHALAAQSPTSLLAAAPVVLLQCDVNTHGGQLTVLLDALGMVIVTTAYPFWLEHTGESWRNEKACFNLVGRFIESLT